MDLENNPKAKNPKKNKSIENIRKTMHKKPKMEPATTKSLTFLMETRRKEIETRKKNEEEKIKENEQRIKKQNDFNERVRKSAVMVENKKRWKGLENDKTANMKKFKDEQKEMVKDYHKRLEEMNQRVSNRPLMMEEAVGKKPVIAMNKDNV